MVLPSWSSSSSSRETSSTMFGLRMGRSESELLLRAWTAEWDSQTPTWGNARESFAGERGSGRKRELLLGNEETTELSDQRAVLKLKFISSRLFILFIYLNEKLKCVSVSSEGDEMNLQVYAVMLQRNASHGTGSWILEERFFFFF